MFNYSFSGSDCDAWAWFSNQGETNQLKKQKNQMKNMEKALEAKKKEIEAAKKKVLEPIEKKLVDGKLKSNKVKVGTWTLTAAADDGKWSASEKQKILNHFGKPYDEAKKILQKRIDKLGSLAQSLNPDIPIQLKNLATLSVSIHEPKGFVRKLGHKDICGVSRSVRTIAGTMICIVVNDHPLGELIRKDPVYQKGYLRRAFEWTLDQQKGTREKRTDWAGDWTGLLHGSHDTNSKISDATGMRLATQLSPFNLYIDYQTEFGKADSSGESRKIEGSWLAEGASYALLDITILSESITSSVNDMVTEISFQFVAADMVPFAGRSAEGYGSAAVSQAIKDIEKYNLETLSSQMKLQKTQKIQWDEIKTKQEIEAEKKKKAADAKKNALKSGSARALSRNTGCVIDGIPGMGPMYPGDSPPYWEDWLNDWS